jgi:preprotein translocase subunit YajC
MIHLLFIPVLGLLIYQFLIIKNQNKRMTQLEASLLNLVNDQQKEIEKLRDDLEASRKNQLKVAEDGDLVVVTYKDKIIYKANPTSKPAS